MTKVETLPPPSFLIPCAGALGLALLILYMGLEQRRREQALLQYPEELRGRISMDEARLKRQEGKIAELNYELDGPIPDEALEAWAAREELPPEPAPPPEPAGD